LESALRAGFNNIKVICMRCIGCAVNVRAIKTIIDLNRRDMNEWTMPWRWRVRANTPDLSWTREVQREHRCKDLCNEKRVGDDG
jgi:hypothetical protein